MQTKKRQDEAHHRALCERVSHSAAVLIRMLGDRDLLVGVFDLIIIPSGYIEIRRMRGMVDDAIPSMFVQDLRDNAPKIRETFLWYFKGLVACDEIAEQSDLDKFEALFEALLAGDAPNGAAANSDEEPEPPKFMD